MTLKNTKLVLGIATAIFALTGTVVSTEAAAKKKVCKYKGKVVKCKKSKKSKRTRVAAEPAYVAPAVVPAAAAYDDSALKAKIAEQDAKIAKLEAQPAAEPVSKSTGKDNMVFFRGGWAHANRDRNGVSINNNPLALDLGVNGERADKDAWYFGAGLDFSVDDNLFGLMDKTEVLGEVMFEYKEFANQVAGNALINGYGGSYKPQGKNSAGLPAHDVTVSQFTLAASPKIKFMKGSAIRPWIIPIGFKIDVISPPSNSITVLQPGMMFGGGVDYNVWKNIYVGMDARYHHALGGGVDGVNTNGFTAGGYIGLGF